MGTATLDLIWLKVFIKNFDSSGDWASFSGLSIPKWCFLQSWKRGYQIYATTTNPINTILVFITAIEYLLVFFKTTRKQNSYLPSTTNSQKQYNALHSEINNLTVTLIYRISKHNWGWNDHSAVQGQCRAGWVLKAYSAINLLFIYSLESILSHRPWSSPERLKS